MGLIIQRSLGFLTLIVCGVYLRKKSKADIAVFDAMSWLMTHVSLPCVILITMNAKTFPVTMLALIPMGMLCNLIFIMSCLLLVRGRHNQAARMVSISGFNIGCFALPLVNGVFSTEAMLGLCMFDLGNAMMCLGFHADIASYWDKRTFSVKKLFYHSIHSIPIWSYLFMLMLCMMKLSLSPAMLPFVEICANANPFLAMLSIGMALKLPKRWQDGKEILYGVLQRLLIALSMAAVMDLLPFPYDVRRMLSLLCLSPISAISCTIARKLQMDHEQAACINSIYMLISLLFMVIFALRFL